MSECGPGAIKNLMKIMMIKFHGILGLIEGFHNGAELAFDPLVFAIYLLMKTKVALWYSSPLEQHDLVAGFQCHPMRNMHLALGTGH